MTRSLKAAVLAAGMALVAAACGDDGGSADVAAADGDGEFTLEIVSPSDGDEVGLPFALEFSTDAEIGPPDSGLHHVHVFVDGDMENFEIVDAETWEITADSEILAGVESGERVLTVTLHTAGHEPVGATDEVTVNLTEGGGQPPEDDGGSGYDY